MDNIYNEWRYIIWNIVNLTRLKTEKGSKAVGSQYFGVVNLRVQNVFINKFYSH